MSTDPAINTLLAAIRTFLLTAGGALFTNGVISPGIWADVQIGAGLIVTIGTAAWGLYNAWYNFRRARAQGVAAGISMTASGKALDESGEVISKFDADATTPPRQVTVATADQIVKQFAPPANSIAKT